MQSLYQLYLTSCEGIILLFLPPNIIIKMNRQKLPNIIHLFYYVVILVFLFTCNFFTYMILIALSKKEMPPPLVGYLLFPRQTT